MISHIASAVIIGTFVWMVYTDPLHKLHHPAPAHQHAPAHVSLPPAKKGTTDAAAMRRALDEANLILTYGVVK